MKKKLVKIGLKVLRLNPIARLEKHKSTGNPIEFPAFAPMIA